MELLILTVFGIIVIGLSAYFVFVRERPKVIRDYITEWQHYEGENVLHTLKVGDILQLRRQPTNPYDKFAVEIYSSNGMKLGFVSRAYSDIVSAALAGKKVVICTIVGINPPPAEPFKRVHIKINVYK
jgi:hypothetical protein